MMKATPFDSRYVPLTQQKSCCVPTCIQMVMLRNKIPLIPAEELGYYLGLIVHPDNANLFYKVRTSKKRPKAGYGTRIYDLKFNPNKVFERLGLPMRLFVRPIEEYSSTKDVAVYLKKVEKEDKDVLLCFNHGVLVDDPEKNGGHVCVFDRIEKNRIRIIDPSPNWPKWRNVTLEKMFIAMKKHSGNTGGFWEINILK